MCLRNFLFILVLTFSLALPALPAWAGKIDAVGADDVRGMIEDALIHFTTEQSLKGQGLQAGTVVVEPAGDHYAVTIPGLSLRSPKTVLDVGTVRLKVLPQKDKTTYDITVILPEKLRTADPAGNRHMEMHIGTPKISGLWSRDLQSFTRMDARFRDVETTAPADTVLRIGALDIEIDMKPDGKAWSGRQATTVKDLKISLNQNQAENRGELTLERFVNNADYKQQDLAARRDRRIQLRELAQKETPEALADFIAGLRQESFLPNGVENRFELKGLRYSGGGPFGVSLRGLDLISTLDNLHKDDSRGKSVVTFEGFAFEGFNDAAPLLSRLVPEEGRIHIVSDRIPAQALFSYFQGTLPGLAKEEDGGARERYAEQIIQGLPGHLGKAGTHLRLDNSFLKAPGLGIFLDGTLEAKENLPHLFAGQIKLSFSGLDTLVRALQETARLQNNPQAAGLAQFLIILQLSSQAETAADGSQKRSYTIDFKEDGRILLNDTDVQGLMPPPG